MIKCYSADLQLKLCLPVNPNLADTAPSRKFIFYSHYSLIRSVEFSKN